MNAAQSPGQPSCVPGGGDGEAIGARRTLVVTVLASLAASAALFLVL